MPQIITTNPDLILTSLKSKSGLKQQNVWPLLHKNILLRSKIRLVVVQECVCASEEDDVLFEVLCALVRWGRTDPQLCLCLWARPRLRLEVERAGAQ